MPEFTDYLSAETISVGGYTRHKKTCLHYVTAGVRLSKFAPRGLIKNL